VFEKTMEKDIEDIGHDFKNKSSIRE